MNTNAFCNCTSLTNLVLPDSIQNIYEAYEWAEYETDDCRTLGTTSLESINVPANLDDPSEFVSSLPESIKNIEINADDNNLKLVDGVLYSPDMTTLYRYLGTSERTSFTVPDSVTCISCNAFRNCINLKDIEIGSNVTEIGENAFCPHCGTAQTQAEQTQPTTNQQQYAAPVDNGGFGWGLLGCCIPLVGLILFLVWKNEKPKTAKAVGMGALISVICSILFYFFSAVLGLGIGLIGL